MDSWEGAGRGRSWVLFLEGNVITKSLSRWEENHGKLGSSWPVAGPTGCTLTSSLQSDLQIHEV